MDFNLSFKKQHTAGIAPDFTIQVARLKGTLNGNPSFPDNPVYTWINYDDVVGGTDISPILIGLTTGDVYDVYVGLSTASENKLGFTAKVVEFETGYNDSRVRKGLFFESTLGTGSCFSVYTYTDETRPSKIVIPNTTTTDIYTDLSDRNINSMAELKSVLKIFRDSYKTKLTRLYTQGMWLVDTAFLSNVCINNLTDPEGGGWVYSQAKIIEYPSWNCSYRSSYVNLRGYWNWHSFMTGEFYYPVPFVETYSGDRIYLSKSLVEPDSDVIYYDSETYPFQETLAAEGKPSVSWDFQSGTSILKFIDQPGQNLLLKNGSVLRINEETESEDNKHYYNVEIVRNYVDESENPHTKNIKAAFNTVYNDADMIHGLWRAVAHNLIVDGVNNNQIGVNNPYKTTTTPMIALRGIYLTESYDVKDKTVEQYAEDHVSSLPSFWNEIPTTPIYFTAVYTSNFDTPYGEETSTARAALWGFSNTMADLMVANVAGYERYSGIDNYTTMCNLFTTMAPDDRIDTFKHPGVININTYDGFDNLFVLSAYIEPEEPEEGSDSIGGSGGGIQTGGNGSYNDTGDNVTEVVTSSLQQSSAFKNWCLGDVRSADCLRNLNCLGGWLSNNSILNQFYTYADKLANIVSLKILYAPEAPTYEANARVPMIHGQIIKGDGESDPSPSYLLVGDQYKETDIIMEGEFVLDEYFGSFLDYEPYTKVQIYLPFTGVHTLNTSDIMGKRISIKAITNFLTGDITYHIMSNTGTCKSILYTFSGNCSVDIPLTATDYSGKVSAGIQTLLGVASMVGGYALATSTGGAGATGGMSMIASGAVAAGTGAFRFMNDKGRTISTGSLGGNSGAMSPMQCYLIVTRPKKVQADDYGEINGFPCMKSYRLADVSGFVKVENAHWEIPEATEDELDEIETLMRNEGALL